MSEELSMKPKKKWYKKWWVWVIAVIVVIGVANQGGNNTTTPTATTPNDNKPVAADNTPAAPAPAPAPEPEAMVVDYKTLHQDYMDNPIAADAKYKNKLLRLTGPVADIDREISGETYITFEIGFLKNVRITFKKTEESKVAELKKGQEVTVEGICTGTLLSEIVALKDSVLVK